VSAEFLHTQTPASSLLESISPRLRAVEARRISA
jgi:hypothetical protein